MAKLKKSKSKARARVSRPKKRGKYAIIEDKIEDTESLDFLRWHPRRVAEHLIAAGRLRLLKREFYDFPAYCRFPYNSYEDK